MEDTGHEKVVLNPERMNLLEFVQRFSDQFPQIIAIDCDYRGVLRFIPAMKLLLVSHIIRQRRLVLETKRDHRLLSIPDTFPIPLERINIFGRIVKREPVSEYMQQMKIDKSHKIRFSMPFDELLISEGVPLRTQDLGLMTFNYVDDQEYIVVHPLDNDKINFNPMAIPLMEQLGVRLVEGHREMSSTQWSSLMDDCKLALQQNDDVEPPELEKVLVSLNGASTTRKSYKNIQSFHPTRYQQPHLHQQQPQPQLHHHQQQPQLHYHQQQPQLHSSIKYQGEAEVNNQRLNEGLRNIKLSNSADRHVTIVTHDAVRAERERGIKPNTVKSPTVVNFREPVKNYYNQYYTKNEPPNLNVSTNSSKIAANRPSYRMEHSGVFVQAGQQRLNIDQKGPRIQSKPSIKLDSRHETRMVPLGDIQHNEMTENHQRIATMGRPNLQNQQHKANGVERDRVRSYEANGVERDRVRSYEANGVERGRVRSYDANNNGHLEKATSQVLFMDITCSDDEVESGSDETFSVLKHNKTFDHQGEKLLQVPSVQHGHINSRHRLRQGKNSKSLSDLRFDRLTTERSRPMMKEESDDTDIENDSQITVIRGKPERQDDFSERVMIAQTSNKKSLRINPMQDVVGRNGSGIRYTEMAKRTINGENHRIIPGLLPDGSRHPHFLTSRDAYPSKISGHESDTSNLYNRYKRPTVKKYPRRMKYSSDADFSGSEELPGQKGIPYRYTDPGYYTRARMKTSKNYNNASDLETVVAKGRTPYVHNFTVGESYPPMANNARDNRFSGSSMFLEPVEEDHRRNIVHGAMDSRHRTRSSPGKVLMLNRQGQVVSRDVQTNYFPTTHGHSNSGQTGPMSRTLINLNNGTNLPPSQGKRSIRYQPQGMYKQVINLR